MLVKKDLFLSMLFKIVVEDSNARDGTVASAVTSKSVRSTITVEPAPVTTNPEPTKLMSVKPTPILFVITSAPTRVLVEPIHTPAINNCPS